MVNSTKDDNGPIRQHKVMAMGKPVDGKSMTGLQGKAGRPSAKVTREKKHPFTGKTNRK